ncbi:MAG: K+/H+ antiporter subunit F [Sulfurovum sp.]|nr:K+/H+ antiporter subunit F [Sulfurovum sp.]
MLETVLHIAFLIVSVAMFLSFYRLIIGPDAIDRVLALDTLYINSIAILILYGIYETSSLYFEVALLISIMGFVGTIALSKFLLRGDIIE